MGDLGCELYQDFIWVRFILPPQMDIAQIDFQATVPMWPAQIYDVSTACCGIVEGNSLKKFWPRSQQKLFWLLIKVNPAQCNHRMIYAYLTMLSFHWGGERNQSREFVFLEAYIAIKSLQLSVILTTQLKCVLLWSLVLKFDIGLLPCTWIWFDEPHFQNLWLHNIPKLQLSKFYISLNCWLCDCFIA